MSKNILYYIYPDTLEKVIFDLHSQIVDTEENIDIVDKNGLENLKFCKTEIVKALEIYKKYNIVPAQVERLIDIYITFKS